ncbi:glycine cleavage system aminomethyltransferase GcvT [Halorientalis pallida]|uniref:Probable aminomethyltransferase n=1 Tax=Halorientalis pallida TaxID=2479928 RepID=A0A498L749_9EURY|nr:glycine cleavage system aminomethyltransferase GcvT [Halorientalis pallida]RXK51555.1 glycine cleavage system aminomethyltransferase GcvT [Halorientalis pallida]
MTGRTPPLHAVHEDVGAKFTDFGGWEMPVEFDSIRTEHAAVRESAGIFDVSHMGEIEVSGPDAETLLQRLTTNDVTALDPGQAQYAMITDEDGIVLDDTVVYNLPADRDADYLFIPNAGHDGQMYDRWVDHRDEWELDATVENRTDDYAMLALQGPEAEERLLDPVADGQRTAICDLSRFAAITATIAGVDCLVARTGYTGEDGFELIVPAAEVETVWNEFDCQPCGLGARDTLRIEMGFLLSGQDFDPEDNPRNPYEAGVGFTIKLDTEFVGRDALERVDAEGVEEKLTGFRLVDRGVPRQGYTVQDLDGEAIGSVTSGTMSPTLDKPIGLAYLPVEYRSPGVNVQVIVRGEPKKAQTQALPFLDR